MKTAAHASSSFLAPPTCFRRLVLLACFLLHGPTAWAYDVTSLADSGPGTLREGLATAPSGEAITFSVTGTITLTSGELVLNDQHEIVGPGATQLTISGNSASRVFNISYAQPNLSGLTIAEGHAVGGDGGGIYLAGADLTINFSDLVIRDNEADGNGGGIYGGIGAGNSTLNLTNGCVIQDNLAGAQGGGLCLDQPSAGSSLTLNVNGGAIQGNEAGGNGGGIQLQSLNGATTALNLSGQITANTANSHGGGIYLDNVGAGSACSLNLVNGNLSANHALASGGGLYLNSTNGATAVLNLSGQITTNTAVGNGGAICMEVSIGGNASLNLMGALSLIGGNDAGGSGGGCYCNTTDGVSAASFSAGCSVAGNDAGLAGGGIYSSVAGAGVGVVNFDGASTLLGGNQAGTGGGGYFKGVTANFSNGCSVASNIAVGSGGGIFNEAVFGTGTVNFSSSELLGNQAGTGGGGYFKGVTANFSNGCSVSGNIAVGSGGGIFNENLFGIGTVNFSSSELAGNHAGVSGGGMYSSASSNFAETNVHDNLAIAHGGGVCMEASSGLNMVNCWIHANNATGNGGGLAWLNNANPAAALNLLTSTISSNQALGSGGGCYLQNSGTILIRSSTISGNSARNNGGGICLDAVLGSSNSLTASTITQNTADSDDDGGGNGGGVYFFRPSLGIECNVLRTIVAENYDTPTNSGSSTKHPDLSGTFLSAGHNLFFDTTGTSLTGFWLMDILGFNPLLGPLANNGGPTLTHALLVNSPALDAGGADLGDGDQRGLPTPQDGNCDGLSVIDIGAFEVAYGSILFGLPPPTITSVSTDWRAGTITITFSDGVNVPTAQTAGNFAITGGTVTVTSAAYGLGYNTVVLHAVGLTTGINYTVQVGSITHICGTSSSLNSTAPFEAPSEIRGRVFIDVDNANGCAFTSGIDWPLPNWKVTANPGGMETLTDANGEYYFIVPPGTYTVSEVVKPTWAQACPAGNYGVTIGPLQIIADQNFVNAASPVVTDLGVDMIAVYPSPLRAPCCNQLMTYLIIYENRGNSAITNASVQLDLVQGTTYQSFTANPTLAAPVGNVWTIPGPLQPGAKGRIYATVLVNNNCASTASVIAHATISPADSTLGNQTDNETTHSVAQRCSFDPNDMTVQPRGCGFEGLVPRDTTFTYLIEFQNLGTGPAARVIVRDTLPNGLDLSTLKMVSASHSYTLAVNGRELAWTFTDIELPAAIDDEPASHGYIRFSVESDPATPAFTQLFNYADIYFDLNPAVTTVTVVNTLSDDIIPIATFTMTPAGTMTRDFHYTGGTPGATLLWDFGPLAIPSTATGPDPTGVVFPPGIHRAILSVSLLGCEAEPAVKVFTVERPQLTVRGIGTNIEIIWNAPGHLQTTQNLQQGPWLTIPNATSPFLTPMDDELRFFRLALP